MADITIPGYEERSDMLVVGLKFDHVSLLNGLMDDSGYRQKPTEAGFNDLLGYFATKLNVDLTSFFVTQDHPNAEAVNAAASSEIGSPARAGDYPPDHPAWAYRRAMRIGIGLGG